MALSRLKQKIIKSVLCYCDCCKSVSVLKQYTIKSNRILLILLMKVSSSQSRQTVSQKKSVVNNILGLKAGKIDIRS